MRVAFVRHTVSVARCPSVLFSTLLSVAVSASSQMRGGRGVKYDVIEIAMMIIDD